MVNSTILVDQPVKYVQQGSELQPFIIDSTEKVYADAPAESTADDLDSDGMPNDWESSNGLNPADASDAGSDFDRDGLTALQEYQHGTNPLGQWTRETLDLTAMPSWTNWLYPIAINDRGSVLLSGGGINPATGTYRHGSWLWTEDGRLHAITHPDATYLHANDLNASDEVVGQAYDADWNRLPFFWSAETGWKDFETPSNVVGPVYPYRINAWGDVLLYDASWKNVLVDADGTVFDTLEDDWTSAQITDINDFREAIGTFTNPADGLSYTFLKAGDFSFATNMPASYPDLESYENFYSWTGMMNNYGEFAGNYYAWGQNASKHGSFFYDGEYELFESSSKSYNYVVAVNEAPQLLIYSYTYENNTHEVQFSLKHGSVEVAMDQLVPAVETWQHTYYQAINNRGETVGYARLQDSTTEVFIDRPDQDRDADGISDDWESYYGLNPDDATDANLDPDGDGISNLGEYRLRRDPNNQDTQSGETGQVADTRPGIDTDGDGMPNVWEIHHGLDWESPADASQDPDRDGYSSLQEFHLGTTPVGNPTYKIEVIAPADVSNVYNARLNDNGRAVANGTLPSGTTGGFIWDNATGARQFTELERPSDGRSYLYSQSENGDVFAGQLQETGDTNRMLPAIWRGNQTPATHDLTGMTQGLIQALSTDGRFALGKAYVNNKWKPIIINEAGILTQLPITGAAQLGYSPLSIHQDGHAAVDLYYSGHGYDPVIWHRDADSNTWIIQRLPAKTSSAIQLSREGELIAVWRAYSGKKYPVRVWTTADGVVDLGTLGGRYTQVKAINNTGAFVGYSQAPDANSSNDLYKAFIGRRDTSGNWAIVPLATDLGHTSYAHSLNDQGEIVGNYYDGTTTTPVIWKGVGNRHDLNLQSNAAVDGYKLTGATTINNRGEIIAQATKDGAYFQVVLRPDSDTDNDGIPDKMENQLGLNPFDANDASSDPDVDGLTNLEEFRNKTNPFLADTDADGMPDGWEILWGLDALDPANATGDPDRDHVTNLQEYQTGTSPTGLYRMNVLDAPQLSDLRYAYVRATNTNGDLLIQGSPHIGGTRHILGVKQDDTFTYHTIPALAPGKNISPREVTASGRVIGTAQDASGIYRLVSWAPGETTLTQHNIPRDTSQSWLSIYDISANGEFILAYWKNPEGQTGQGLIRLDETGTTTVEQFGISTSQSLPNGYYSRWLSRVTDDGLLIGTEEFYDYTENTSESEILLLDPIAGEINIPLPEPENESETETQHPNSYSYTWPTGNPLADGTQLLTREIWTDNIHTETHLLDTENGTIEPIAYPLKGYSYPVGISDAGTMAAQGENMHGNLISQGQSLNLSGLRILGNQSAFLADPATLPRADQLHPGLRLTPSLISETGTIAGSSHPNTSDGNAIIWTITEVLDSDIDGMADDWEKYHASQLLALIDLTTITAEAVQQLQSGNLTATTDYDGDGKTAGERYQQASAGNAIPTNNDADGDGIEDSLDADPDDAEINWEKTPETSYFWVEQVQKTGAAALSRHGHILFPYDSWDLFQENTEPSEILWDSTISDWVDLPGSGNWTGSGLKLNGEAIAVSAGWVAVSDMNDDGALVGYSDYSGADDGGPSEIPVYMTWKLKENPTNGYQQPLYAVPSANYAESSGLLDYAIAVYDYLANGDPSLIISDDGAIGGQAYSLSSSSNEFMSCFVSNGNLNGHTNTMTKWGDFNIASPLAILDQTTGLITERHNDLTNILHFKNPEGIQSLDELLPHTASFFWDADMSRTPATVGVPATNGNPAIPASPGGRVWFSISHSEGNAVYLEKRVGGTGPARWHNPPSMAQGAKRLNARGEAITDTHLWRNGKYELLNDIVSKPDALTIDKAIDLSSNGIILVQATEEGTQKTGLLVPVDLVPDYNRDGKIDQEDRGKVTESNPYRFWVNDDNDKTVEARRDEGNDEPGQSINAQDASDDKVDGVRDLVDFFPLHLDLKTLLEVFPSDKYYYIIKHQDAAVNFFEFPAVKLDNSDEAHAPHSHLKHVLQATSFKSKDLKSTNGWGGQLTSSFLSQAKNGKGVLVCEAVKQTNKPLILEIHKETEIGDPNPFPSVAQIEFPIEIAGVEKMYRHINIRPAAAGTGGRATEITEPENYPDDMPGLESGKYFVFVHGYNVNGEQARGWHAEAFKRMWWSGSKARFVGVSWHGEESQGGVGMTSPVASLIPDSMTPNYHANVINAFQTADDLASSLGQLDGEISIAAHSLGNMVVGLAVQDHGLQVENYFLVDAAVAMESYNGGEAKQANMTNGDWVNYDKRLWASEWHVLPWPQNDPRKKLTWRGRLGDLVSRTNAYNFYSSEEEILNNAAAGHSSGFLGAIADDLVWDSVVGGAVLGERTWVLQELLKGKGVSGEVLGSIYGGWKFNYKYLTWPVDDPPPPALSQIYASIYQSATFPFLEPTYVTKLLEPAETTGLAGQSQQLMAKSFFDPPPAGKTHAELLAQAFPARTNPAGRNPVDIFNTPQENRNFDMVTLKNSWFSTETNEKRWLHSDIRDVGYLYTYKVYDKFKELGEFDQ